MAAFVCVCAWSNLALNRHAAAGSRTANFIVIHFRERLFTMACPKGVSGNPKGRTPGTKNRKTLISEAVLARILKDKTTPLDFLLTTMSSAKVPFALRIDAAKAAAPYVHKRMPQAVEVSGGVGVTHKGGVMIVPATPGSVEEWSKASAQAQAKLKEEVKK
jgi:hypothetical protein